MVYPLLEHAVYKGHSSLCIKDTAQLFQSISSQHGIF